MSGLVPWLASLTEDLRGRLEGITPRTRVAAQENSRAAAIAAHRSAAALGVSDRIMQAGCGSAEVVLVLAAGRAARFPPPAVAPVARPRRGALHELAVSLLVFPAMLVDRRTGLRDAYGRSEAALAPKRSSLPKRLMRMLLPPLASARKTVAGRVSYFA